VEIAAFGTKPGIGRTGVHFRYYELSEYEKLSGPQKDELQQWRKDNPEIATGGKRSKRNKKGKRKDPSENNAVGNNDRSIAAAVAKELDRRANESRDAGAAVRKENDAMRAYIMSLFNDGTESNKKV